MKNKKASSSPSLVKAIIALTAICLITAFALAAIDHVTAPIIEAAEKKAENEALAKVLPDAASFEMLNLEELSLDKKISTVYRDTAGGGFVFKIVTKGYKSKMTILCGIGSDGKLDGAICLSSSETLGYEKTYGDSFVGKDSDSVMSVDTVSGATLTTKAYREAIRIALDAFETINK